MAAAHEREPSVKRGRALGALIVAVLPLFVVGLTPMTTVGASTLADTGPAPITGSAIGFAESVAVRDLPPTAAPTGAFRTRPLPNPGPRRTGRAPADPLIGVAAGTTPAPNFTFEGVAYMSGGYPGDPTGDVGPNDYVQMTNQGEQIFDKHGNPLSAPFFLPCSNAAGDPQVVYDRAEDRWVLSQIRVTGLCFAVSATADPLGTYHLYEFDTGGLPDYAKLGIQGDTYYESSNGPVGYSVLAFNRKAMLAGKPAAAATFVRFTSVAPNMLLPADVDGATMPPTGSPGLFYTFLSGAFHGGGDRLELYGLHADFGTPTN